MALRVVCPHCKAPRLIAISQLGTEVTCTSCEERYPADESAGAPRPIPGAGPRKQSDPPHSSRAPRREKPRRSRQEQQAVRGREALRSPAIALLVLWSLGALIELMFAFVAVFSLTMADELGPAAKKEQPALIALAVVYAIVVPAGMYGATCMLRCTSYGWSVASMVLMCIGFMGCLLGWAVAIWAFITLLQPDVRAAFEFGGNIARSRQYAPPFAMPDADPAAPAAPDWMGEGESPPPDTTPPVSPPAPLPPTDDNAGLR